MYVAEHVYDYWGVYFGEALAGKTIKIRLSKGEAKFWADELNEAYRRGCENSYNDGFDDGYAEGYDDA